MRSPRLVALTAVLCTGMAVPAMAALVRIGSIDLTNRNTADVIDLHGNLPPRVEALSLQARDSDVMCRDVTARFRSGDTLQIFHGFIRRGRDEIVNMLPVHRDLNRIDFDCRATDGAGGTMDVVADVTAGRVVVDPGRVVIDRYTTGGLDTTGWIPIATEDFIGPYDHAMTFTGWRGRNVDALALRPLNDDAVCRNVRATFANGDTRIVDISADVLPRDRMTMIDLPGFRRDVTRIDMNCHAEHGNMVTVQVLASR